jgi:AbiTii-like protein
MSDSGSDLLRRLQDQAVDESIPVSRLLRQAKVLAARLDYAPLKLWVDQELTGYKTDDDLPPYRILRGVQSHGHFVGPFGQELKNALIPRDVFPGEEAQSLIGKVNLFEGVAVYESLVRDAQAGGVSELGHPWPDGTLVMMANRIYENMTCLEAHHVIPVSQIAGLLDQVRNATLTFSLEVERINPKAAESPSGSHLIADKDLAAIYRQMISKRL